MAALMVILFFVFGSLIGSFLNVVTLRLPRAKRLSGRSACPHCGTGLVYYDLIPIVSFLALRGRCRNCGKRISSRYWLIELATGLCFAVVGWYFFSAGQPSYLEVLRALFAVSLFVVIFVIDLEHFLILDKVVLFGAAVFLALNLAVGWQTGSYSFFYMSIAAALTAGAAFFLVWYISRGRWLGFGDVKLAALLGLILGWPQVAVVLLLAFWIGTIVSLPLVLFGRKQLSSAVPFGTFLTAAAFITIFIGQPLVDWYLRLIGWQ